MNNFLSLWKDYLLANQDKLRSAREYGDLYESFIAQFPEMRKEFGVFYTPQYIVDYIVENTLGKKIKEIENSLSFGEGKGGAIMDEIAKIKVLDPSCGSGSFLLGAYDYLINYHKDYYLKNIQYYASSEMEDWLYKKQRKKYLNDDDTLSLSIKKQILLNNIFGVDIDYQASEVTKLSLLIKCLEGETQSSIEAQKKLFKEKALPTLDKNILSANSLIGFDFYDNNLDLLLQPSFKEQMKINAFDWKDGFKEIFRQGGFDVIIGNPPYVLLQELEQKAIFDYALKNYVSAKYKIDMYQLFLEKAVKLLKINGLLGYIMPNTFLKNIHAEPIRKILLDNTKINEILLFMYQVFSQASVDTCILLFEKNIENTDNEIIIKEAKAVFLPKEVRKIKQDLFRKNKRLDFNISANSFDNEILAKIKSKSKVLNEFCGAYFGIQTFDRTKYVAKKKINKDYQPVIDGGNIETYFLKPHQEYVHFIPEAIKSGGQEKFYRQERICIRQIGNYPIATLVGSGIFALNTVYNIYSQSDIDLKFILGIINSKTNQFFWKKTHSDEKVTFPKIKKEAILSILIPNLDLSKKQEKEVYQLIIRAVTTLLELNEKKSKTKLTTEIDQLNNRIKHNENLINEKLYQLYELTQEEIAIIENE
jgi:hypothetical protein